LEKYNLFETSAKNVFALKTILKKIAIKSLMISCEEHDVMK